MVKNIINPDKINMAKEEDDDNLPDKDAAKEFYAKYEPKEIIGRYVGRMLIFINLGLITK